MHSCIYEGIVTHRRLVPVLHQFQYRLFMVYLDLDEVPGLVGGKGVLADSKYASASFLERDHLAGGGKPLKNQIYDFIQAETGQSVLGPVRLLTQLRYFSYYFSPLNMFYVYDQAGSRVEYIVAEVNNTPWNERHFYLLHDGNRLAGSKASDSAVNQYGHDKEFHVSPFMEMNMQYRWKVTDPSDALSISLANYQDSKNVFSAAMSLERRELSTSQLRKMTWRYPWMTAQIMAAIYYQALKLWWKKCPLYTHPKKLTTLSTLAQDSPSATQMEAPNTQPTAAP